MKDLKKPAVYLETSFINRLADPLKRDPRPAGTTRQPRDWWRVYRKEYTLIASRATVDECSQYANARLVRLRSPYLAKATSPRLSTSEVNKLVVALRQPHGPLPEAEILDATHIAAACGDFRLPIPPHLEPEAHRQPIHSRPGGQHLPGLPN